MRKLPTMSGMVRMIVKGGRTMLLATALMSAGGCSGLFNVDAADVTQSSEFDTPAGAVQRRAGVLASFAIAMPVQAEYSGILADEFTSSSTTIDQRIVTPTTHDGYMYRVVQEFRLHALVAIHGLRTYAPKPGWRIGELYTIVALAETILAENYCSGIPVGHIVNGNIGGVSIVTRAELIRMALAHLDTAATYSTGTDSIGTFTKIIRARALLDSGDVHAAAQVVAGVPVGYVYQTQNSEMQPNTLFPDLSPSGGIFGPSPPLTSVADREGGNGLPFLSGNDPRASALPYASVSAPMPVATGIEAMLIVAEAKLRANDTTGWANSLNQLRAQASQPLPALTPDSTTTASPSLRTQVMFRERGFWLFATGHRLGDLRRMVRQYGFSANTVFPVGTYLGGPAQYGGDLLLVPNNEETTPGYAGCVDTSA